MRAAKRNVVVGLLSATLLAPTACTTGTGALTGAGIGGVAGGLIAHNNPVAGAVVGAAAGAVIGGIIGHINEEQREKLQQQSPQTWETIQHNDEVAAKNSNNTSNSNNTGNTGATASNASSTDTPNTPNTPNTSNNPAASDKPTPLTVDDVKAMASSGIKEDVICDEITQSQAVYSQQDLDTAQQVTPPIDPKVIECMKQHMTT
jgi:outer membrane lipoprotein SlyB